MEIKLSSTQKRILLEHHLKPKAFKCNQKTSAMLDLVNMGLLEKTLCFNNPHTEDRINYARRTMTEQISAIMLLVEIYLKNKKNKSYEKILASSDEVYKIKNSVGWHSWPKGAYEAVFQGGPIPKEWGYETYRLTENALKLLSDRKVTITL